MTAQKNAQEQLIQQQIHMTSSTLFIIHSKRDYIILGWVQQHVY